MSTPDSTLLLSGYLSITPSPAQAQSCGSANQQVLSDIYEPVSVDLWQEKVVTLTVDGPVTISLADIPNVNVLSIRADNQITGTITSTAGAAPVPVGKFFFLMTSDVAITALTLQRTAGVQTTVRIVLAHDASSV